MLSSNEVYYTDDWTKGKNFFKNFSVPVIGDAPNHYRQRKRRCIGNDSENPPERARCLEARRHRSFDHAAEAERQIAALAGLQRRAVTPFGRTA